MSKISELSDGGVIQGGDTLIAVRSGGNVKVTYGGTTTANIDGGTIDGTVIGGTTPAAGSFTTGSFTGNVLFGDNDKAIFGAGSDLQIYHDGSGSYIDDVGTGNLFVRADSLQLRRANGSQLYLAANTGAEVALYYAGNSKLATTSTGIDVTGTVTADGYSSANQTPDIQITRSSSGTGVQTGPNITLSDGTTNNTTTLQVTQGRFGVWNYGGGSWLERLSIDASGNVGIGTDLPSARLHTKDTTGSAVKLLQLETAWSSPSGNKSIDWTDSVNTLGRISVDYTAPKASMRFGSLYNSGYQTGDLMTLTADGNLLVNRTSAFTTAKMEIQSDAGDASTLALNSIDSDGSILEFYKAGSTVGSIGTYVNLPYIGIADVNLLFDPAGPHVLPRGTNGGARDGAINLGESSNRFKDLYLSGTLNGISTTKSASGNRWGILPEVESNGVIEIGRYIDFHSTNADTSDYGARLDFDGTNLISTAPIRASGGVRLGGQGAANTLDDYEEGTWIPTYGGTTTIGTGTYSFQNGSYTKVGNVVTVNGYFRSISHTGTGNIQLRDLPFTVASGNNNYAVLTIGESFNLTKSTDAVIGGYAIPNTDRVQLRQMDTDTATTSTANVPMDINFDLLFTLVYRTA